MAQRKFGEPVNAGCATNVVLTVKVCKFSKFIQRRGDVNERDMEERCRI